MSEAKDDLLYISHVVDSIKAVELYTKGADFKEFCANPMMYDAVVRKLQILAESTQRISEKLKKENPHIPWRDMAGFRNILVHDYLEGIDPEAVWDVITLDLPQLKESFQSIKDNWKGI